ncbi:hypothetical protein CRG98_029192 [Punica granatum]|uniref:Uncharacterized protein n=1 Tax=Punica granatum TaxID=22663 RepID=A0A2I0J2I4_PUNGR|nr:hypothetical protein CRG98_029192 [Punica granatum]
MLFSSPGPGEPRARGNRAARVLGLGLGFALSLATRFPRALGLPSLGLATHMVGFVTLLRSVLERSNLVTEWPDWSSSAREESEEVGWVTGNGCSAGRWQRVVATTAGQRWRQRGDDRKGRG